MSQNEALIIQMREAIDHIEEAYEFMLAYAAQGRANDSENEGASQLREYLERFKAAVARVQTGTPELLPVDQPGDAFRDRFLTDAAVMSSVIELLLSKKSISSDMIDNTNGLIAVRAFLTDIFFFDQVVLPQHAG